MVPYCYIMQNSPPKQKNQITQKHITGRRTYTEARYDLITLLTLNSVSLQSTYLRNRFLEHNAAL